MAAKRFKEADAIKSSGEKKKDEDGDEYDSGPEAHRTAEDDAFIDREGDDNELLAEYDAEDQVCVSSILFVCLRVRGGGPTSLHAAPPSPAPAQNFGDIAPSRKPGAKKKRRGDRDHSDDENAGGKAKSKSSAASASSAAKKRRAGLTDAQKQAMVDGLIRDMRAAAATDRADRKAGKPAVAKLKLMNTVRLTVANTSLQEMLLEGTAIGASADYSAANNPTILSVFREWLRPLPGSDLPPLDLRAGIYDLIAKLPVAQHHLRDSRIGEVLFALSQHPGETPANRMMLSRLIERYARMIFAKDDSYRGGLDAMLDAQAQQQMGARAGGREAPQPSSSSSSASAAALGLGNSLLIPSGADLDMLVAEDVEASLRAEHGGGGSSSGSPAGSSSSSSSSLQSSAAAAASARAPQPPPAYEGRHARIPAPVVFDFVRRAVRADVDVAASADAPAVSSGGRGGGGSRGGGSGKGSSKEPASASAALKKRITDARRASRKEGLAPAVRMSVEGRGT